MRVRYTPGRHLLIGSGQRWLLVHADAAVDLDGLLHTLTQGPVSWQSVRGHLPDPLPDLVWIDPDAEPATRVNGTGRLRGDGVRIATLDAEKDPEAADLADGLPLIAGVVRAGLVEVADGPASQPPGGRRRSEPATPRKPLIDGIPEAIRSSRATRPTDPTTTTHPPVPPTSSDPPTAAEDHDGSTVAVDRDADPATVRRGGSPTNPTVPASPHLAQPTSDTVLAVFCACGQPTDPARPACRVCEATLPDQTPQRIPQPRLGTLRLADGRTVPLDRGVIIGRQPTAPPDLAWPHLVKLPDESTFVSRNHLRVELDGWRVMVTDLGTRGGTTLRAPGREPLRLTPREAYAWEPGTLLDLADAYDVSFVL